VSSSEYLRRNQATDAPQIRGYVRNCVTSKTKLDITYQKPCYKRCLKVVIRVRNAQLSTAHFWRGWQRSEQLSCVQHVLLEGAMAKWLRRYQLKLWQNIVV